ncbi:hypothetical protein K469DRAFT_709854 [Zopfia rhizophila CBS 207.26]|uniref:Uncharacterized protein n=1 Tax=Zopfia rhizophila CBS 207.26 TaxID=1314779 RepID=A0A6A6EUB9_9PEZI|nr:hypothetical protein K469DRAFT_709854 [Zopfia rhizophila CBS 207.26]
MYPQQLGNMCGDAMFRYLRIDDLLELSLVYTTRSSPLAWLEALPTISHNAHRSPSPSSTNSLYPAPFSKRLSSVAATVLNASA